MAGRKTWLLGLAGGTAVLGLGLAAWRLPLETFNTLVPKDGDSVLVAAGVPYGRDERQKLDIYAPRGGVAGSRLPVILFFYGGSWASGSRTGYGFVGRALAAKGFVVVVPDYRIGPAVTYPGFVEDGAAAVRWVEAHAQGYGGDPSRIVVSGHSAGAYIAAMLAVDDRWLGRQRAAIKGFAGIAGPYDFAPFDVPASQAAFGTWPDPAETQPVTWAGPGDPPALLLVGEQDDVVRPKNAESLAAKLSAAGVAVSLKRYAGVGHVGMVTTIARPFRYRAPVLEDIAAFVRAVSAE